MSLGIILGLLGFAVIVGLAAYAWHLTQKVKEQELRQKEALANTELEYRKQQLALLKDVRFLARSVLQEQCEITEGVLRLRYAVTKLDMQVWERDELADVRQLYEGVKDMPILEAYKKLSPKEQHKLDMARWRLEDQHKDGILKALEWLVTFEFPSVSKVH